MTIIEDRLAALADITLDVGSHKNIDAGACLLEAVGWLAGEPWSDHPKCASPVIGAFGRSFNDHLDDEGRQRLKAYAPKIIGTNTGPADEDARSWLISNWMLHVHLPTWLDLAGMTEQAALVRAIPDVTSWDDWEASRPLVRRVRDAAWQLRNERLEPLKAKVREAVLAKMSERRSAAVADAVAAAAADAVAAADAAPRVGVWRAVYDATKPIFRKAIEEHATVGPVALAMKESGFELLDQLCAIGRVEVPA